jgi:predicted nucleotidyltransferase
MLGTLITSKTRIKLLLKFFLNANNTGYLKNLEQEFEDSSNGIRVELNKFEEAGLLHSETVGNKKIFKANQKHPLFNDIRSIILKYSGVDQIIETIINRLGNVSSVYLIGSLAKGLESNSIDLILIGDVNKEYLIQLIDKAEPIVGKKISYVIYQPQEFQANNSKILNKEHLLIWNA